MAKAENYLPSWLLTGEKRGESSLDIFSLRKGANNKQLFTFHWILAILIFTAYMLKEIMLMLSLR
jgi:hypothetical protein